MSYEMLTGKLPFEADTPWQWATQHMTAQPIPFEVSAPAKNIPEGMRQAILKGLSKDRDLRPATAREFFTELSDGGRMTVEAAPAELAAARTGTAAMEAVPAFAASGPAQAAPLMGSPHPAPTPMAVAAAHVPPAAPRPTGGGGGSGKGLIFGLVGVGAVLLGAIVIVVIKGQKPPNNDLPLINTAPTVATQPPPPPTVDTAPPVDTSPPPAAGGTPATGGAPAAETGKPATGGSGGKSVPPPVKPAGDPCAACLSAAASGNATGVSGTVNKCTDAAKQAECKSTLGRTAVGAVRTAALNGQCDRAKSLAAAAEGLGAKGASRGLKGTSCQ
jgi:serine/threonine-protein kinase